MDTEFQYPDVRRGRVCDVFTDQSRDLNKSFFGLVMRAKPKAADILVIAEGAWAIYLDCWYHGDPRIETSGPEVWEDGTKAVFQLTEVELERDRLSDMLQRHRGLMTNQGNRMRDLEEKVEKILRRLSSVEEGPKRRRKKPEEAEAVA